MNNSESNTMSSLQSSLIGYSNTKKIQECLLTFIISSCITSNKEYRDNMRQFINEIMIESNLSIKDIDKLYEIVNDTIRRHIIYQLNGQIRKGIILASQREDMTEKEADLISRFNLDELIESVFHMYTYNLFKDVSIYMNLISTLVVFNKFRNEKIINLHLILANMINIMNEDFHTKFEKESDKVFHQIIMTDEHYSLLKLGIGQLIRLVLDKTYNSVTAFIIDSQ